MRRAFFLCLALVILPAAAAPEALADRPIAVANAGFETVGTGVLPSGWSLEPHEMTKTYRAGLPAWAVFRGEKVESEGYLGPERFELAVR